jgi:hypothetical protein
MFQLFCSTLILSDQLQAGYTPAICKRKTVPALNGCALSKSAQNRAVALKRFLPAGERCES